MRKRLPIALLFLSLIFSFSSQAQETTLCAEFVNPPGIQNPIVISGEIRDPATKDPIPFAGVLFRVGKKVYCNATADYQGKFTLEIDPNWVKGQDMEIVYFFRMYAEQVKTYAKGDHLKEVIYLRHQTEAVKTLLQ